MLVHFPPGSGQKAALMQPMEIVKSVLQTDAPIVDAAIHAEASLVKAAPDVAGQVFHAGFTGSAEVIERSLIERA